MREKRKCFRGSQFYDLSPLKEDPNLFTPLRVPEGSEFPEIPPITRKEMRSSELFNSFDQLPFEHSSTLPLYSYSVLMTSSISYSARGHLVSKLPLLRLFDHSIFRLELAFFPFSRWRNSISRHTFLSKKCNIFPKFRELFTRNVQSKVFSWGHLSSSLWVLKRKL